MVRPLFCVARGFFFLRQLHTPGVLADPKIGWQRFGFTLFNSAAFVQEFLNESIICGGLGDLFHRCGLSWLRVAPEIGLRRNLAGMWGKGRAKRSFPCYTSQKIIILKSLHFLGTTIKPWKQRTRWHFAVLKQGIEIRNL